VVPKLVKEQCAVRGWPAEWVTDETVTLQLAVVDKQTKSQLLPLSSQVQADPGSALGLCVGDVRVRVRMVEESDQKADDGADEVDVAVQAVADGRDHQFAIRVKSARAGEHQLRVWVRDVEVPNSPFTLHIKSNQVW
jgi:hypothetical protein